ncbi:Acetyltransferase (isoleucine patch superfamily) [Pilibacter termitis]|uniref:Acetyltransferase (Isoleucine patch superfamily) n=1 Tax=Pilibacter termitis TaxID=263852 RepID=A0A1T4QZN7_9ENTE|nr:acyltransferase [Pilibacter termitis]SKA09193.1 Acetyltransferase (isoleucine patch superfamily) [Pilibacter termitis]
MILPEKENTFLLRKRDGSVEENPHIEGLKVVFKNKTGNQVILYEGAKFENTKIIIGDNSKLEIKATTTTGIRNSQFVLEGGGGHHVFIDNGVSIQGAIFLCKSGENLGINIGKDVMISDGVLFQASDIHVIFDIYTGEIINRYPDEIVIEDHVWIGRNVTINKGVSISKNSIIGIGSVVTKKFEEENVAIAGNPARIVKNGINWKRDYLGSLVGK